MKCDTCVFAIFFLRSEVQSRICLRICSTNEQYFALLSSKCRMLRNRNHSCGINLERVVGSLANGTNGIITFHDKDRRMLPRYLCASMTPHHPRHTTLPPIKKPRQTFDPLLPLHRGRRLGRDVVHHPVHALHLVADLRAHLLQKLRLELVPVRGHAVG